MPANNSYIIKRDGHEEAYDSRKVTNTVFRACKNSHLEEGRCNEVAEKVRSSVDQWMAGKEKIDTQELFEKIANEIREHDNDAAFLYATHRDIS